MDSMFSWQREFDVRLEGVSDELLLSRNLDRLGDDRASSEESLHVFEGVWIKLRIIVLRELFQMHRNRSSEVAPSLLSRKYENCRDQTHQRFEDLVHDCLSRLAPRRLRGVAIHSVLCDIDVEAAEIDCTKLVYPVVNFVKLVLLVGISALLD